MSDVDERLNLRDLPPVEPVPVPGRFSQTLLRQFERCKRSGYLYIKHRGGAPSHELDRGTAFHLFAARALLLLLERDEPQIDPDTAKVLVDEVRAARPDLTLTMAEWDEVRVMAYHWAVGMAVDPSKVVAVERKFVLDIGGGRTLSGKVDVGVIDGDLAQVQDYKTSMDVPDQAKFEASFQVVRFYPVLLVFGRPVEEVPCAECRGVAGNRTCENCGGRGKTELLLPSLGEGINWVRGQEVYPRYLDDDGTVGSLRTRDVVLSRAEVADRRHDLVALVDALEESLRTWKFPAVGGAHCSECPCRPECPLPAHLRRYGGTINTVDEAAEAAEWLMHSKARSTATHKELRAFADAHGIVVRFGRDKVMEFKEGGSWKTDWEKLESGVERAREYGEPFDLGMVRRRLSNTSFNARTLTADELADERDAERQSLEEAER